MENMTPRRKNWASETSFLRFSRRSFPNLLHPSARTTWRTSTLTSSGRHFPRTCSGCEVFGPVRGSGNSGNKIPIRHQEIHQRGEQFLGPEVSWVDGTGAIRRRDKKPERWLRPEFRYPLRGRPIVWLRARKGLVSRSVANEKLHFPWRKCWFLL